MPTPLLPAFSDAAWQSISLRLGLAPQQARIVRLVMRNKRDSEIADELGLSVPTVRTYLTRAFIRLGVRDRLELILHVVAIMELVRSDGGRRG